MSNSLKVIVKKLYFGVCASLLSSAVMAQGVGSVQESRPYIPGQSQSSAASPTSSSVVNNDGLSLLLEQNRQLQVEVQALRGMVEEQAFEIRKIQRNSLSRYTNVDDRLISLESGAEVTSTTAITTNTTSIPPASSSAIAAPVSRSVDSSNSGLNSSAIEQQPSAVPRIASQPITRSIGRNSGRGTLQPAVLSEQQLYQMAYDSVINSNFGLSVAEFDQYLSSYPQGRFVTNAHYWKGQAYLYLNRYAEARESYEIILNQYSDSPKLPDAMYGLGLAYEGLGNIPQAKRLLADIKRRFPNTGVANLADTRLLSLD
ncbi:MAG: tol-pal system protein YbgF [SAR86 cluster bacterium]|uniref:Cell division coordinator CpoB n=1 Tax=SAR86 cluster bacterium TaxID=2030880 RepID=A0A2A5BAP9_9GAMM|nr:MAG: tol-pal system protein YbgF [SAR86 cluster bacterium]